MQLLILKQRYLVSIYGNQTSSTKASLIEVKALQWLVLHEYDVCSAGSYHTYMHTSQHGKASRVQVKWYGLLA